MARDRMRDMVVSGVTKARDMTGARGVAGVDMVRGMAVWGIARVDEARNMDVTGVVRPGMGRGLRRQRMWLGWVWSGMWL